MRRSTILWALFLAVLTGCDDSSDSDECAPDESLEVSQAMVEAVADDHHRVESFIVIDAPAADVWAVLTDFESMPSWSTSFQGLTGDFQDGGEVEAVYLVANPMTGEVGPVAFPHVLSMVDGARFGWSDPIVGFAGITDNHVFAVEAISACQTRFIQTDEFRGTDPGITTEVLAGLSAQGYESFNAELKAEVEGR